MQKINLNDRVKFKLTEYGKEVFIEQWNKYALINRQVSMKHLEDKTDDEGFTTMQFHDAFNFFGEFMSVGQPEVFEGNNFFLL